MAETSSANETFYVGLCMAGAVSAGAYTAGVMDYLLEALQEWQNRKDAGAPGTPSHNIVIPVIGGASAGGMTALITASALTKPIKPVTKPSGDLLAEHEENKLYHSWVDLLGPQMFPMMLETNDIGKNGIISLLNSKFISDVAERALNKQSGPAKMPPYFDPNLKIFTTLTNLEGFSYNLAFNANIPTNKYFMTIHNDYACFKMDGSGTEEDGWMHLDFSDEEVLKTARSAAMATGAFPVGLESRELKRKSTHVNRIRWCEDVTKNTPVQGDECITLNVDGGVINNEPFEKVRDILGSLTGQDDDKNDDYRKFDKFKSTVLMIDPFPSVQPGTFKRDQKLFKIIGSTFSAMLQQMRAKPASLASAMDAKNAGQYLIAPTRMRPILNVCDEKQKVGELEDVAGEKAIACGAFDGFAGFMSKEFRVHDYFLGRFNCELFLRNYFTIPASSVDANPIFKAGYAGTNIDQFKANDGSVQIIPIFTPKPADDYFPIPKFSNGSNWPTVKEENIEAFMPHVKKRVNALAMNAIKVKGLNKILLWVGVKVLLGKLLTNSAMSTIKEALIKHQLMQGEIKK